MAYKPWLTVQDVPSEGTASRIDGVKIKRVYHLMSRLERQVFEVIEWSDQVIGIREQLHPQSFRSKPERYLDRHLAR